MLANVSATRLTLYAFISAIEIDLRDFFINNINEHNITFILDDDILIKLKLRSQKDGHINADLSLLIEYLDFGDCVSLLNKFKRTTPKSFHSSFELITKELEKITPIRNRVMHSRPLEYEDFPTIADFIESLVRYQVIQWNNTNEIKEKIKNDPSIVFGLNIPVIDNYAESRVMHNIPTAEFDDTGFIGRQNERQVIKQKIYGNYPVISIIGDGGIGKTALVQRCLYDIIDDSNGPFDAIIWVSLKTRVLNNGEFKNINNAIHDTFELFKNISYQLMGDATSVNNSLESNVSEIIEYMHNFKILLVLDNLETINSETIRDFILKIPLGSKVVITSRIGLGEFESRHLLQGFSDREAVYYLRRLAQNYQLSSVLKMEEEALIKICNTNLYSNPLAIKWFLLNLQKGEPMEAILSHTDDLTNFCMSNVYEKLSPNTKTVLETLLICNKKCTDAELDYLLDLDSIMHRKALNELVSTNMVRMESYSEKEKLKSVFFITDFAKEYLQQHCKPKNNTFIEVTKKIKSLRGITENILIDIVMNPYDPKAITAESEDEKIAAFYLKQALKFSSQEDYKNAILFINKAKDAVPNFFEIYKISGFINASKGDLFTADSEYQTALELKPDSAPVLALYGGFRLCFIEDFEGALDSTNKAQLYDPDNPEIKLQRGRILKQLNKYSEASVLFNEILRSESFLKSKSLRIAIDQSADNLRRWADKCITDEKFDEAIVLLQNAIEVINLLDEHEKDRKIIKTISKILKTTQYTCINSNQEYQRGINLFIEILSKYVRNIRHSDNYKDIKIGIKSLFPSFSSENIKKIEEFLVDDLKELAKKVVLETEGYINYKLKGFGFIVNKFYDNGLFFHWSDVLDDFSKLSESDKVRFELGMSDRGPVAKKVKVIEMFSL